MAAAANTLTVIDPGRQPVCACASSFGMGQGGVARLTPTDARARELARRAVEAAEAHETRQLAKQEKIGKGKRPVQRSSGGP